MTSTYRTTARVAFLVTITLTFGFHTAAAQTPIGGDVNVVNLIGRDGKTVGTARLHDTPHGVLMHLDLTGIPKGPHAIHIHEVGKCEPPFESAGGHFNPAKRHHGFAHPDGAHAGDLPNIHIPDSGKATVEVIARDVRINEGDAALSDADGSALVIHAGADDHQTDPAGGAGDRIACGVIGSKK